MDLIWRDQKIKLIAKKKTDAVDEPDAVDETDAVDEPDASNDKKSKKTGAEESFEVGRAKKSGHSIDYATTIEDAYDQLNGILGKDGIKSLTSDTERLMQQQAQLAGSLKDMGPLIEKMGPMMKSVEGMMKDMPAGAKGDMLGKVEAMLSNLQK